MKHRQMMHKYLTNIQEWRKHLIRHYTKWFPKRTTYNVEHPRYTFFSNYCMKCRKILLCSDEVEKGCSEYLCQKTFHERYR